MNKIKIDNLSEMKQEKRWVCWKLEQRKDGKTTKPPYNPRTGRHAQTNNPATWTDYQTAKEAVDQGDFDGLGFVFTGSDYIGIDLDHVYDPERGEIWEKAEEILKAARSYTEISPSGDGFHILCKGGLDRSSDDPRTVDFNVGGVHRKFEIYDGSDARYFTVTEKVFSDRPLEDRPEELQIMYERHFRSPRLEQRAEAAEVDPELDEDSAEFEISATLQKAFRSKNGDKIRKLYEDGDLSDHEGDHSRADQALCNHLVYWFKGDLDLTDQAFRESKLMRAKWDRSAGGGMTYGERTLRNALEQYQTREAQKTQETQRTRETEKKKGRFIPCNVCEYIGKGKFDSDIEYFKKYKHRKTGFAQLDGITLYPGLAFLGGVTSLGKTTFSVQLADHLVSQREHVLYFSMEQQPIEIVSKGLTRTLYEIAPGTRLTNIDIKNGATSKDLERAKEIYAERSKNLTVVNCNFHTTVEQISEYIERQTQKIGASPVIFIDYLQLIAAPDDSRMSDKERVDHVVAALKELQQEQELLIVCMSNFNRMSYTDPVTESSFKESGQIEFGADYLWALQPAIMNSSRYLYKVGKQGGVKQTTVLERVAMLQKERERYPREIEFVCLKNRNGKQTMKAFFQYYLSMDYFRENPMSAYSDKKASQELLKDAISREKIEIRTTPSAYFDFSECIDDSDEDEEEDLSVHEDF